MAKPGAALLKLMGRMAKKREYSLQLAQVVDASAGGLKVKFLGDEEPTLQYFRQLASGVSLNDWVVCARMGNSWVVLGRWAPAAAISTGVSFWDDFVWESLPSDLYLSANAHKHGWGLEYTKAGPGQYYITTEAAGQHGYVVLNYNCPPRRDPRFYAGIHSGFGAGASPCEGFLGFYHQGWPRAGDPPDTRDWDHAAFWYDSAKGSNWWASMGVGPATGPLLEQELDVPVDGGPLDTWRDFSIELLSAQYTAKFYVGGVLKATLVGDETSFPRFYLDFDWVMDVYRGGAAGANHTMMVDYLRIDLADRGY